MVNRMKTKIFCRLTGRQLEKKKTFCRTEKKNNKFLGAIVILLKLLKTVVSILKKSDNLQKCDPWVLMFIYVRLLLGFTTASTGLLLKAKVPRQLCGDFEQQERSEHDSRIPSNSIEMGWNLKWIWQELFPNWKLWHKQHQWRQNQMSCLLGTAS